MNTNKLIATSAVLLSVLLTGCGGGGDAGTVSVATFPLDSAAQSFLTSSHNFTANYTDPTNGDLYTLAYGFTPGNDSSFEGQTAKTANFTLSLNKNGSPFTTTSEIIYFQIGPVKSLGVTLGTGEYIVTANQVALPASGKVGDIGNLDTKTFYTNNTKSTSTATEVDTWSLQADTATTAYLCANSSISYTVGINVSGSECYKINTSGAILGNKVTIAINGKSVTFSS